MDFDESDESLEEEDELDAELSFLLIDKLSIFNLHLFAGTKKSQLWMRARISRIVGGHEGHNFQYFGGWREKYLCIAATSTQAERVLSWKGFLLKKRRLSLSGESMSSPCSFSSRTTLSSNPLMVQLYLQKMPTLNDCDCFITLF